MPKRQKYGSGGRAAGIVAEKFAVSSATVYRAVKLLKSGDDALIGRVRKGEVSINAACKLLGKDKADVPAEKAA
jgi:hypothetical protein